MGEGKLRMHRTGNDKTRSMVAIDAHLRSNAGIHGRFGKGRSKTDPQSRQSIKSKLRGGDFDV